MSLFSLPNELLLQITGYLKTAGDLYSLICSNRRFSLLLTKKLRRYAYSKEHTMSALFCAASVGDRRMIRSILDQGPLTILPPIMVLECINSKSNKLDMQIVYNPLESCTDRIIDRIVGLGARIRLRDMGSFQLVPKLFAESEIYGAYPPLHWAAFNSHFQVARRLLNRGADINERATIPPIKMCRDCGVSGHLLGIEYSCVEAFSVTPLHIAAYVGDERTVKLLLERGADIEAEAMLKRSAIHLAARMGHEGVVGLLIEYGADIHKPGGLGSSPIFEAMTFGYYGVVKLLLEKGADPNLTRRDITLGRSRNTLLHCLLGDSGIYWPAKRKEMLELLLQHGADPTIRGSSWRSVKDIAQARGDTYFLRVLADRSRGSVDDIVQKQRDTDLIGVLVEYPPHEVGVSEPNPRMQKKRRGIKMWKVKRWYYLAQILAVRRFVGLFKSLGSMLNRNKK